MIRGVQTQIYHAGSTVKYKSDDVAYPVMECCLKRSVVPARCSSSVPCTAGLYGYIATAAGARPHSVGTGIGGCISATCARVITGGGALQAPHLKYLVSINPEVFVLFQPGLASRPKRPECLPYRSVPYHTWV